MRGVALLLIALISGSGAVAPAVRAQLDPVMLGQGHTMNAAIRAQANQNGRSSSRHARTSADRTARTCANAARMQASGSNDAKLVRLRQLCRQAGY